GQRGPVEDQLVLAAHLVHVHEGTGAVRGPGGEHALALGQTPGVVGRGVEVDDQLGAAVGLLGDGPGRAPRVLAYRHPDAVADDRVDLTGGDAHPRHEIRLRETASVLDELIERSASPAWAGVAVQRLRDQNGEVESRLTEDPSLAKALVTVTSASRSLTELCLAEPA